MQCQMSTIIRKHKMFQQEGGTFTPMRKAINVSHLYMTLLDIRDRIQKDDKYESLYIKIFQNLSDTKRIRTYMYNEFGVKLSIGKAQNLASFVHLCYNFALATRRKHFGQCLLPPPESEYSAWQRSLVVLQRARKMKIIHTRIEYTFRNDLKIGVYVPKRKAIIIPDFYLPCICPQSQPESSCSTGRSVNTSDELPQLC